MLLVAQIVTRIMHVLFLSSLIFLTRGHTLVEASTQRLAFKNQREQYKQNKVPSDYVFGLFSCCYQNERSRKAENLACVAWRFCRAGLRSGVATCPRPPLLLSSPNQNRHATQAT